MPLPEPIQTFIDQQADGAPERYDDLRAVIFNGTLKRSPEPSNTDGMLAIVRGILRRVEVTVDEIRTIDHDIPAGMETDLREHGCDRDEFPAIYRELVTPADIILICGPIWLGDQSSQTRTIIERLYAYSGEVNAAGQWSYYGKVGGVLTTGNEDGGKHVSAKPLKGFGSAGVLEIVEDFDGETYRQSTPCGSSTQCMRCIVSKRSRPTELQCRNPIWN